MKLLMLALSVVLVASAQADEYYFSATLGTGSDTNKYRAGCAPGASSIDLRAATGRDLWICRSTSSVGATNAVILAGTDKVLGNKVNVALAMGRVVKGSIQSVPDLLRDLLVDSGVIKAGRDGKYKIYLGDPDPIWQATQLTYDTLGLEDRGKLADLWNLVETSVAYAATLSTETFTNSDGDLAGRTHVHPWSEPVGTGWTILTNRANNTTGGGTQLGRLDTSLDTDDFTVTADLTALSRTGGGFARCGIVGRKDNSATQTYYRFYAEKVAATWELDRVNAGTATSLGSVATAPADGDVMLLVMDASTITGKVNGATVIGPVTDGSPITGNTYAGIYSNKSTTTMNCDIDNMIVVDITYSVGRRRNF
jgi:hypothetical protein